MAVVFAIRDAPSDGPPHDRTDRHVSEVFEHLRGIVVASACSVSAEVSSTSNLARTHNVRLRWHRRTAYNVGESNEEESGEGERTREVSARAWQRTLFFG